MKKYSCIYLSFLFTFFIYPSESENEQKPKIKDMIIIETITLGADGRVRIDRIEKKRKPHNRTQISTIIKDPAQISHVQSIPK